MTAVSLPERLINRFTLRQKPSRASRRGFLAGAAVVGAALAVDPWGFLVRPASAYDTVCGAAPACADGYSVFCCTINKGVNSCPPDSFIGGWWKADASSFCGGAARYYIDCNAYRDGGWKCHCASGTCDSRRVACNQFRYGQCSLSIPYEQTGPVVCRIISCTPPWEQFGGICTTSSATDNSTATHSAPCVGTPPRGALEAVTVAEKSIRVRGWAFDPDQPATALTMAVQVDGVTVRWAVTAVARPDVDASFGITGLHGFDITVAAAAGAHTVAVQALNIAGGNRNGLLGSRPVVVPAPDNLPIGRIDAVTSEPGAILRVRGWALDRDQPTTSILIAIYLDGHFDHWYPTAVANQAVNTAFHTTGTHGFDVSLSAPPGPHQVDVYGINVGGGVGNPLIGSARATVVDVAPVGALEQPSVSAGQVVLSGWAFDPDQPATSIPVAIYRDGIFVHWFPTATPRPDVNKAHGILGTHGFSVPIASAPGRHVFTAFAINAGPAGANPEIGTTAVVVPA